MLSEDRCKDKDDYRVTKHCVAFADEALHGFQLGPLASFPQTSSENLLSRSSPSS
jgi:hypothetical protein